MAVSGRLDLPASESVDSEAARDRLAAIAQRVRDEVRARSIDLGAYNTRESADDVDAIRQALGVERVVLVAHSYGTHLGLAVIKRYGEHVERAILAGVNGLDMRWREPDASDQWLRRVSEAVAKSQGVASSSEGFTDQVRRVLAQFQREPLVVRLNNEDVLIGKSEIQLYVVLRSGDMGFVRTLPTLFANLDRRVRMDQVAVAIQQATRQRPIGTAMTYAMHVASGASEPLRRRIATQAPSAIFGNAINWGIGDDTFVKALGVRDLGEEFRAPFRSTVPVLLVTASLDGRTSEADAREVGRQFREANYVTLEGASHDFLFRLDSATLLSQPIASFLSRESIGDRRFTVPVTFDRPE